MLAKDLQEKIDIASVNELDLPRDEKTKILKYYLYYKKDLNKAFKRYLYEAKQADIQETKLMIKQFRAKEREVKKNARKV